MKPKTIPLSADSGLVLIPTPGSPSMLSYSRVNGVLTVLNADTGTNVLQLSGLEAETALNTILSWASEAPVQDVTSALIQAAANR